MADANVDLSTLRCTGDAACVGGKHPDPPLDAWPLLVWCPAHAEHGAKVFTEDGKASVHDLAVALAECPDLAKLAARFGTSEAHASQAISYALAAGFMAS